MGCAWPWASALFLPTKSLSKTEVPLLGLWLQKGRLIPDPLQPAFKKESKQTPSIARPPEGTGEPRKQALPPILRAKTAAAALDPRPRRGTCRAGSPRSADLLPRLAESRGTVPTPGAGRARLVRGASSSGTSGAFGLPEPPRSSSGGAAATGVRTPVGHHAVMEVTMAAG